MNWIYSSRGAECVLRRILQPEKTGVNIVFREDKEEGAEVFFIYNATRYDYDLVASIQKALPGAKVSMRISDQRLGSMVIIVDLSNRSSCGLWSLFLVFSIMCVIYVVCSAPSNTDYVHFSE